MLKVLELSELFEPNRIESKSIESKRNQSNRIEINRIESIRIETKRIEFRVRIKFESFTVKYLDLIEVNQYSKILQ